VTLDVTVPANASATVVRPGHDGEPLRVLAGVHHWEYSVPESVVADWADEPRDDVPFGS
jgi:hypothetical protein